MPKVLLQERVGVRFFVCLKGGRGSGKLRELVGGD